MAAPTAKTQIGGDARVVSHPSFRTVPETLFPLQSEEAKREYDTLSRILFESGRFTVASHRALSSYAVQFDLITCARATGKTLRAAHFIQLDKARTKLNLDDIDTPIASAESSQANKFARSGFASRRR